MLKVPPVPTKTELLALPADPFRLLIVFVPPPVARSPLPMSVTVTMAETLLPTSTLPTLPVAATPPPNVPVLLIATLCTGATPVPARVVVALLAALLVPPFEKLSTTVVVAVPVPVGLKT